jgi:hypothetical protein
MADEFVDELSGRGRMGMGRLGAFMTVFADDGCAAAAAWMGNGAQGDFYRNDELPSLTQALAKKYLSVAGL